MPWLRTPSPATAAARCAGAPADDLRVDLCAEGDGADEHHVIVRQHEVHEAGGGGGEERDDARHGFARTVARGRHERPHEQDDTDHEVDGWVRAGEAEVVREDRRLYAVAQAEFAEQRVHVGLHGAHGDAELLGDLRVGEAGRDQGEDAPPAAGQAVQVGGAPGRNDVTACARCARVANNTGTTAEQRTIG
ncbi:hypothetical protein GCM10022233_43350 [Streptomyces shaanxiensis]|uniref:Uncharacterized protein n=1 Tax=Streptomyces shaanxiensis TaxID=653357 RepID=A0ABP7VCQ9_9ACTN